MSRHELSDSLATLAQTVVGILTVFESAGADGMVPMIEMDGGTLKASITVPKRVGENAGKLFDAAGEAIVTVRGYHHFGSRTVHGVTLWWVCDE